LRDTTLNKRNISRAFVLALALAGPNAVNAQQAGSNSGINRVAEQARFWEDRGRYDLANEAWQKVLKADPDNAEALTALGANRAGAGDKAAAAQYLDRLKQSDPGNAGVNRIEQSIAEDKPAAPAAATQESNPNQQALVEARSLSRDKNYEGAVEAYRRYFGKKQPSDRLALEFYQTLAGTREGWDEARQGLKRLTEQHPGDPQYELAYAEHLTYREKTRRSGIAELKTLEQRPAVSSPARAARRQALVWLAAQRGDIPLYKDYLQKYPDDTAVKKRLAQIQSDVARPTPASRSPQRSQPQAPRNPADILCQRGFAQLDDNNLDEAEALFRQALDVDSDNPTAFGGLGIIRLRTEQFQEAEQLLTRASRIQPSTARRWKQALSTARFWSAAREAEAAREAGQLDEAVRLYRNALATKPGETVVRVSFADTLLAAGQLDEAVDSYRRALREDPGNAAAQRGIVNALAQQGRTEEALDFAQQIPEQDRGQIGGLTELRAQSLRAAAEQATQQGDFGRAEAQLRDALALDPANPYIRLDLARLYRKLNERDKANSLVDGLLATEGDLPDALFIKALIVSEEQKWWDGLQLLERVPPRQRSQAMRDLQHRLWIRYETERAIAFAREGQVQGASQILARVEQETGDDPEALGALAQAYAEVGDEQRAVALMREALSDLSDPSPGLRLQYAGLLSQMGQDVEFGAQLDALRRMQGQLNPDQREGLASLEAGNAIRQADRLREAGRLADAYEYLRPHLEVNPNDPSLLMALARLYGDFNEPDRALDIYYDLLEQDPGNLNTYDGAIRAAIAAGRNDEAQWLVERAISLAPANPRMYVLAGRLARARGEDDQAVSLYKQALALDAENSAAGLGPGGEETGKAPLYLLEAGQRGQSDNPFGQPQSLRYENYNRPLGPRQPVGDVPAGGFRRSSADATTYRYSLPPQQPAYPPRQPARSYGAPRTVQAQDQYYRVQRQQPVPVRRTPDPVVPRRSNTGGQPVAWVRVQDEPRNYQPALAPSRLVRRRLDGPMRPEALPLRPVNNPRGQLIDEIADIESSRSNWVAGGLNLRNRDGQSGLGELIDIETPLEGSLGQIGPGRVRLRAVPVFLDAGSLGGSDAQSFGLLPVAEAEGGAGSAATFVNSNDYDQSEAGAAVGLVYELQDWRFDVGSSPLGFPEENIVGGIRWSPTFDNILLNVDLSRRSVTDSLLSYAGTEDPFLTQEAGEEVTFGGVTRNGGRIDIANDQGAFGIYGNLAGYFIEGEQVEDNSQLEIGGGYYQHLWRRPDNQFTVGLNVTSFFYDKNLSGFTLGHGGYFSPQYYAAVGVPVEWVGRESRFSYRLGGSLGLQSFSEDDEDIFPGNFGQAQSRLEAAGGLGGITQIEGESNTGLGFNIFGAAEYLVTPFLSFGARGSFDNAKDFDQLSVGAYVRYWFRPQRPDRLPPPRTLAPHYVGDPEW